MTSDPKDHARSADAATAPAAAAGQGWLLGEPWNDPEWVAKWAAAEIEATPFTTMLAKLRREEGSSVTLLSDNPDFNGQPNNAVEVCGSWTNWRERRFTANSLHGAVLAAFKTMLDEDAPHPSPETPDAASGTPPNPSNPTVRLDV